MSSNLQIAWIYHINIHYNTGVLFTKWF